MNGSRSSGPARVRPADLALAVVFAGAAALFGSATVLPWFLWAAVVAAGVGGTAALRPSGRPAAARYAAAPALGALVVLAASSPSTSAAGLFGGLAGIALFAWLSEDPQRAPGGSRRAAPALGLIVVALGIAWASGFLLPSGTAQIGIGSGLLVAAAILIAVLLGRPDLIDQEPPATA